MKFKVTSISTAEVEAETKEQAMEDLGLNPNDSRVTVEEIPEVSQSLANFAKFIDQAQKELDKAATLTKQKEKELFELESKKWEQICRYLISDIIPLLRKTDVYAHAVKILDQMNLYLYGDVGDSSAWFIGECKFADFRVTNVLYNDTVKFKDSEEPTKYHSSFPASTVVRNWDIIKPNLEKNVIELLSKGYKERIEKQNKLYDKYDFLLKQQKTDPLDEDQ